MVDEKKVILMTKMAAFEKNEGGDVMQSARYLRGDYIGSQLIKAVAGATFSYLLVLGLYLYYNFETMMDQMYELDMQAFGMSVLRYYLIFLVIYVAFAYLVSSVKYYTDRYKVRKYKSNLRRLSKYYEERKS